MTLVAAVVGMNLRHGFNSLAVTLFAVNRERAVWVITGVDGALSLGATSLWVVQGGPEFAAFGPLTAVAVFAIPASLYLLAAEGTLSVRRLIQSVSIWAALYLALGAAAYGIGRLVRPGEASELAAIGATVGFCYLVVMLQPAIRGEMGEYLRPRLLRIGHWAKRK
jgi:hypothetical protein